MNAPNSAEDTKRSNLRLALILASVALTFFVGFIAKMVVFAHH